MTAQRQLQKWQFCVLSEDVKEWYQSPDSVTFRILCISLLEKLLPLSSSRPLMSSFCVFLIFHFIPKVGWQKRFSREQSTC